MRKYNHHLQGLCQQQVSMRLNQANNPFRSKIRPLAAAKGFFQAQTIPTPLQQAKANLFIQAATAALVSA